MKLSLRHQKLRDWWEFQHLYHFFSSNSCRAIHNSQLTHSSPPTAPITNNSNIKPDSIQSPSDKKIPIQHIENLRTQLVNCKAYQAYLFRENPKLAKNQISFKLSTLQPDILSSYSYFYISSKHTLQTKKPQNTSILKPSNELDFFEGMEPTEIENHSSNYNGCNNRKNQVEKLESSLKENVQHNVSLANKQSNNYDFSKPSLNGQSVKFTSRQNQIKRQREWIYLSHYLTISGLNPIHIISGSDDGREPDFTLIFYHNSGLYYVGVELTTLPRLREQMGDEKLIAKRWYWQSLHQMAREREKQQIDNNGKLLTENLVKSYDRFRLPLKTLYMPKSEFKNLAKRPSTITQTDVNAVMEKKSHKVHSYHTRRPLQELWLLVHTNKYQPDSILQAPDIELTHDSEYDQIHITRYPSHKVIKVKNAKQSVSLVN